MYQFNGWNSCNFFFNWISGLYILFIYQFNGYFGDHSLIHTCAFLLISQFNGSNSCRFFNFPFFFLISQLNRYFRDQLLIRTHALFWVYELWFGISFNCSTQLVEFIKYIYIYINFSTQYTLWKSISQSYPCTFLSVWITILVYFFYFSTQFVQFRD